MPTAVLVAHDVLLFASAADALGGPVLRVELPEGATAGMLLAAVAERAIRAGGPPLPTATRLAVNQAFAAPGRVLRAGDEVAVIPPVAGG